MAKQVSKKVKRVSKSAARRNTASVKLLVNGQPSPLSKAQADFLAQFVPQNSDQIDKEKVRVAVTKVMERASCISGLTNFKKHASDVSALTTWVLAKGGSLDWQSLMSNSIILEFERAGSGLRIEATSTERRSRLCNLASKINPGSDAPPLPKPSGHRSVKPRYSAREDEAIIDIALTQPGESTRRQLCLIVGLSRGAGVSGDELRPLHRKDVVELGEDGIDVTIGTEPNKRIVPVRRRYEDLVRIGIAGLGPNELLLGKVETRRNVAGAIIKQAVILSGSPEITAARLRTSWIAELMCEDIPVAVILTAAGLKSARTLDDLIAHLHLDPNIQAERVRLQGGAK
jgi:hypothetical protein